MEMNISAGGLNTTSPPRCSVATFTMPPSLIEEHGMTELATPGCSMLAVRLVPCRAMLCSTQTRELRTGDLLPANNLGSFRPTTSTTPKLVTDHRLRQVHMENYFFGLPSRHAIPLKPLKAAR